MIVDESAVDLNSRSSVRFGTIAEAESEVDGNAAADVKTGAGVNAGTNAVVKTGAGVAVNAGTDAVVKTGAGVAVNAGTDAVVKTGAGVAVNAGTDAVVKTGAGVAVNAGTDAVVKTGAGVAVNAGTDAAAGVVDNTFVSSVFRPRGRPRVRRAVTSPFHVDGATGTRNRSGVTVSGVEVGASLPNIGFGRQNESVGTTVWGSGSSPGLSGSVVVRTLFLEGFMGRLGVGRMAL